MNKRPRRPVKHGCGRLLPAASDLFGEPRYCGQGTPPVWHLGCAPPPRRPPLAQTVARRERAHSLALARKFWKAFPFPDARDLAKLLRDYKAGRV